MANTARERLLEALADYDCPCALLALEAAAEIAETGMHYQSIAERIRALAEEIRNAR